MGKQTEEKQVPMRLARLNKGQRDFIRRRAFLTKKIEKHSSQKYLDFVDKSPYHGAGIQVYWSGGEGLKVSNSSSLDVCIDAKEVAERARRGVELPASWYRKEYEAGRFKVTHEMPDCAVRPKLNIKFTNEARALKAAQTKEYNRVVRSVKQLHKSRIVLRDELRVDCMEFNKWVYEVLEPELMLTLDGANALERIMEMMPKPL